MIRHFSSSELRYTPQRWPVSRRVLAFLAIFMGCVLVDVAVFYALYLVARWVIA